MLPDIFLNQCVMNEMFVFWMRIVPSVMIVLLVLLIFVVFEDEINCSAKIHVGNAVCMNSLKNVASVLNKAC